ncbi:hypothetical protein LSM04_003897 [Trypanosoma melophagium]|uniref:uncharacterized protein n=1 Tax=Trypanosoma melophagium TaxID=715481 RepID=UPI00351A9C69|nr:hypothetical protein LSM04_003897 [Trypanosoma melophagium]
MSSIERTVRSGSAPLQSIKESYQKDLKGGNVIMAVTMALVPHDALSEIYNSEVEIVNGVEDSLEIKDNKNNNNSNNQQEKKSSFEFFFKSIIFSFFYNGSAFFLLSW